MARKITFDVEVKNRKAEANIKRINKNLKDIGNSGKQGAKNASSGFNELDKSIKRAEADVKKLAKTMKDVKSTTARVSAAGGAGVIGTGALGALGAGALGAGALAVSTKGANTLYNTINKLPTATKLFTTALMSVSSELKRGKSLADALSRTIKELGDKDNLEGILSAETYGGGKGGGGKGLGDMKASLMSIAKFAAVATVAGYAMKKAYDFGKAGASIKDLEAGFSNFATSLGFNSNKIVKDLQSVSNGTISTANLMQSAGRSMLLGIPADELSGLMQVARTTSLITGQSVTEAFNDITLAVGRGSKMILDNLGIIVDVGKANKDYADSLGVTVEQLTDVDKKQAFLNATMKEGARVVKALGGLVKEVDAYDKLSASIENFGNNLKKQTSEVIKPAVKWLGELLERYNAISEAAAHYSGMETPSSIGSVGDVDRQLEYAREKLDDLKKRKSEAGSTWTGFLLNKDDVFNDDIKAYEQQIKALEQRREAIIKLEEVATENKKNKDKIAAEERTKLIDQQNKEMLERAEEYNLAYQKVVLSEDEYEVLALKTKWAEKIKAEEEGSAAWIAAANAASAEYAKLRSDQDEKIKEKANKELREQQDKMDELAQQYNSAVLDPIKDGFRSMIDGSKSAGDAFKEMAVDIVANLAEMIAQQAIFNNLQGGASGTGGIGGFLASFFHSGGVVGQPTTTKSVHPGLFLNAPRLHNGLASDEFPAILQRGEKVIPKNTSGSSAPTVNIINNTSKDIDEPEVSFDVVNNITNIVLKDISNNKNGSRTSFKQLMK